MKAKFLADIDIALDGREMPWPEGTGQVWDHLMHGTWSLCLKEFDIPGLVEKELARGTISRIIKNSSGRDILDAEWAELQDAVENYDRVALPFSPHEIGESSRCLKVGHVIDLFGLKGLQTTKANAENIEPE